MASRITENRVAVSRRGALLAQIEPGDFVHLDLPRVNEVIAQEPVLPKTWPARNCTRSTGRSRTRICRSLPACLGLDPVVRYAIHIHPLIVDQITASPRARQFADRRTVHNEVLALGASSLLVNYMEPGLAL